MKNVFKACRLLGIGLLFTISCAPSDQYTIKEIGSFHVGGRQVTLSGLPEKEIVFTKGGPPTKVNPNGEFQVEQMYVQYLIPADQKGKYPLLMWHGGGLTGVTWESKPDGNPVRHSVGLPYQILSLPYAMASLIDSPLHQISIPNCGISSEM